MIYSIYFNVSNYFLILLPTVILFLCEVKLLELACDNVLKEFIRLSLLQLHLLSLARDLYFDWCLESYIDKLLGKSIAFINSFLTTFAYTSLTVIFYLSAFLCFSRCIIMFCTYFLLTLAPIENRYFLIVTFNYPVSLNIVDFGF